MEQLSAKTNYLLEQISNPIGKIDLTIDCEGVFGFPEDWTKMDEQNPFFSYKFVTLDFEKTGGKIINKKNPEATEKDNSKKNPLPKKGAPAGPNLPAIDKKPPINDHVIPEIALQNNPNSIANNENKLESSEIDPQEQIWKSYEDINLNPSIKFDDMKETNPSSISKNKITEEINNKNSLNTVTKEGEDLIIFEEKIALGGEWVIFCRYPNQSEDEISKLKKKVKSPLLNDLNPLYAKGWVNLKEFQTPGTTEITIRSPLEQILTGDPNIDANTYDFKNTYIKLKIKTNPAVTLTINDQIKLSDILPKSTSVLKVDTFSKSTFDFCTELKNSMKDVVQHFCNNLGQQNNASVNAKISNPEKSNIKKQSEKNTKTYEESARMSFESYLKNDTSIRAKLKESIGKSLKQVVKNKFQKIGPVTGLSLDKSDQLYGELYQFFVKEFDHCLHELVADQKDEMHLNVIPNHNYLVKEHQQTINKITKETINQTLLRLSEEYHTVGMTICSEKKLQELLKLNQTDPANYYNLSLYYLKIKQLDHAESCLMKALALDNTNKEFHTLLSLFSLKKGRPKESILVLRNLISRDNASSSSYVINNLIMAFTYTHYLNDPKIGKKYFAIVQRVTLKKLGLISNIKTETNSSLINNMMKQPHLTMEQNDNLWYLLADFFLKYDFYELVEKLTPSFYDKSSIPYKKVLASIAMARGNFDDSIKIYNEILQGNHKNSEILQLKALCCYKKSLGKFVVFNAQNFEYLDKVSDLMFTAMKIDPKARIFSNFLVIGFSFLNQQKWSEAKSVLSYACQLNYKSPVPWFGIGISCIKLLQYDEAFEALKQGNFCDSQNSELLGYLALCCLKMSKFVQAIQTVRDLFHLNLYNFELLHEIGEEFYKNNYLDEAEVCLKRIEELVKNEENTVMAKVFWSLGKVLLKKKKYAEAKDYLECAEGVCDNVNEKEEIIFLKKEAEKFQKNE